MTSRTSCQLKLRFVSENLSVFHWKKVWCHEFLQRIIRCHKRCVGLMVGGFILVIYSFCKIAIKGLPHVRKWSRKKFFEGRENLIVITWEKWHFEESKQTEITLTQLIKYQWRLVKKNILGLSDWSALING